MKPTRWEPINKRKEAFSPKSLFNTPHEIGEMANNLRLETPTGRKKPQTGAWIIIPSTSYWAFVEKI
jgi:hypothetical protein